MKNISHLQLKKALFVPGCVQFQATITKQFYPALTMIATTNGVQCEYKGVKFTVPYNNIECMVHEAE